MASLNHIFKTERLLLRAFHDVDAESFFNLNNDPIVMQFTGDVPFKSVQESLEFIKTYSAYSDFGFGRWTIISKENGACLGWCGLKRHADNSVDLGYRLHQQYWGKGYATEAAKGAINFGFDTLGLTEIIGRTARANTASIRVLEKTGMTYWKDAPCEGIIDSVFYRIQNQSITE